MFIADAQTAEHYLRRVMGFQQEEFWALALASNLKLIGSKLIFLGTVDMCLIHPRDVFRYAILTNASQLMIAHNHPSGDSQPSMEDLRVTSKLVQSGKMVGIPIVDHLILTENECFSFTRHRLIRKTAR
jgi:DNA repair protein RadC